MFTNDEVEWLAQDRCYCIPCERTRYGCPKKKPKDCPLIPDYKDAAEFEARVAIRIARYARVAGACGADDWSLWDILKFARMAVEEEMDAHN